MKGKKAGYKYVIKECKKCSIQRLAFKGTIILSFLQLKNIGDNNFKGKKGPV
jgi:hypothetical protein